MLATRKLSSQLGHQFLSECGQESSSIPDRIQRRIRLVPAEGFEPPTV